MVIVPARDAGEVGVGEAALLAQQPRACADHLLQRLMGVAHLGGAIGTQRLAVIALVVFQRMPERGVGTEEAGVEIGQPVVEAIKAGRALCEAQALRDALRGQVVEDGQALAEQFALRGAQGRGFTQWIEATVVFALHLAGHVDAAQVIRLA